MNIDISTKGQQTKAIHAGESPEKQNSASSPHICMSSTFVVDKPASFIYLMETEDLIESSYRLEGSEREKYEATAGSEGLFRFSVGLEDADDLIKDLDRIL